MSGGGGSSDVQYTQSPEQRQIMAATLPMFQGLGQYGMERYFGGAPQMGAPSMAGVLSSQPMYDIPNPATMMPTSDWWGSLAPEVKQGLYAPYVEAGQGLMGMMGGRGQLGSARGGFSGAAGAALGELAGQAANNVGLAGWQMTAPGATAAWNADLARNMNAYNVGQQERLADYNTAMNVWNRPMSVLNYMGQGMPQAYAQPESNQFGGALSGGLMGYMGSSMMGMNPWLGGGLGALAGFFA